MRAMCCLVIGLLTLTTPKAQAATGFQIGPIISNGQAAGIIVGIVVVGVGVGAGITYLIVHERSIAEGCIAESSGKRTLVGSDKTVYSLLDTGPSLPIGQRAKLKGHKSGPKSARSFQVEKILKVYGPCQPQAAP
jgi:hypothetical protein